MSPMDAWVNMMTPHITHAVSKMTIMDPFFALILAKPVWVIQAGGMMVNGPNR
jgi:hypothetical protein